MPQSLDYTSHFLTSQDGLRLHYRDYGSAQDPGVPVVCLSGLTRNAADFGILAHALAQGAAGGKKRRVICPDYRGRGLSDFDPNWENYNLMVENGDILNVLTVAGIESAVFIGTSRGGLHTMVLSATRPGVLRGAVLNDIGPVIEQIGLIRIRNYVGKTPLPHSWDEAVDLLKNINAAHFTALSDAEWQVFARQIFREENGKPVGAYDPNLVKPMEGLDLTVPVPTMWPQFEGLANIPVMVVRGENSDLLTAETVDEMTKRHPNCVALNVPNEGHAPLLNDAPTIKAIAAFVAKCD